MGDRLGIPGAVDFCSLALQSSHIFSLAHSTLPLFSLPPFSLLFSLFLSFYYPTTPIYLTINPFSPLFSYSLYSLHPFNNNIYNMPYPTPPAANLLTLSLHPKLLKHIHQSTTIHLQSISIHIHTHTHTHIHASTFLHNTIYDFYILYQSLYTFTEFLVYVIELFSTRRPTCKFRQIQENLSFCMSIHKNTHMSSIYRN